MKQQLKDLINSTMDECYDYSHYQEAILSEDETQCYRTGYIDGLKAALMIVNECVTEDEEYYNSAYTALGWFYLFKSNAFIAENPDSIA